MSRRKGQYVTCPICGSNNDPGEKCECQIVDDCNYCIHDGKEKCCGECWVKGNGSKNYFVNSLIPR